MTYWCFFYSFIRICISLLLQVLTLSVTLYYLTLTAQPLLILLHGRSAITVHKIYVMETSHLFSTWETYYMLYSVNSILSLINISCNLGSVAIANPILMNNSKSCCTLCLFLSVSVFVSYFHFTGCHSLVSCSYFTQNWLFTRLAGNVWHFAQWDWSSQNRYTQCLSNLIFCLHLSCTWEQMNLKILMWHYLLFILFLKVRCRLYVHMAYIMCVLYLRRLD